MLCYVWLVVVRCQQYRQLSFECLLNSCGRMNQTDLCEKWFTIFLSLSHKNHYNTSSFQSKFTVVASFVGCWYFFFCYSSILFMWMQHVSLPLLKKSNRKSSQSQPEITPTMCSVVSIIFDALNTFLNCFYFCHLWQSKLKTIRSLNLQKWNWRRKKAATTTTADE